MALLVSRRARDNRIMNPHVVYVLGLGHSGSTILQYMLCNNEATLGLGEVHHAAAGLPWSQSTEDCSCGAAIASCPLWKDLKPGESEAPRDWYARLVARGAELYPEKTHWVDTSKRMEGVQPWLELLAEGGIASFRVVYLVRDIRGWAAARQIRQRRRERRSTPLFSSFNTWRKKQRLFLGFLSECLRDIDHEIVSYEALVFQNREQVVRMSRFLGFSEDESSSVVSLGAGTVHDAFGNQMKYDQNKRSSIVYDDRWQYRFGVNLLALCHYPAWRLNARLRRDGRSA